MEHFVQAKVKIKGKVQAVSFRLWTKQNAEKLGLAGWVRNCDNGSVEALFQGYKPVVEDMVSRCRTGPDQAVVKKLQVTWEEPARIKYDFTILT